MSERLARAWHWLMTTRYTRWLEGEVERLRAENHALVNSLLGTAGVPPLDLPESARRGGAPVLPLRRRSWYQIATQREAEAARVARARAASE